VKAVDVELGCGPTTFRLRSVVDSVPPTLVRVHLRIELPAPMVRALGAPLAVGLTEKQALELAEVLCAAVAALAAASGPPVVDAGGVE
jgi:hypothetical protein